MRDFKKLFKAVELIEQEGIDAINKVTVLVGVKVAFALLITHLRREKGSMETFPADPEINDKVNQEIIAFFKENELI